MIDETNSTSSVEAEVSPDIATFTSDQRSEWLMSGKYPEPTNKEDAATSEAKEESVVEETETNSDTDGGKPNDTQRESRPKRGAESRKQELASEIQDLLAERARIRKEVEEAKAVKPAEVAAAKLVETKSEAPKKPPKPNIDDFETYEAWETAVEETSDKYLTDLADYKAKEAVRLDREARNKEATERTEQEEKQKTAKSWQSKVKESKKAHDDFEKVAFSPDIPITTAMQQFLVDSELGGEILYKLGKDLELAESIAAMNQFAAWKELTRLELSTPRTTKETLKPNKITRSNPPPADVGGYGASSEDEVEAAQKSGDTRAYINAMNKRDLARMQKRA